MSRRSAAREITARPEGGGLEIVVMRRGLAGFDAPGNG